MTSWRGTKCISLPDAHRRDRRVVSNAILSKDLNSAIQSCNPATQRTFGYTAAELIVRPVHILSPEERRAEEKDMLRRIRDGERFDHFDTIRITKGQRRLDVSLTISPVRDASGVVIIASSIVRDITEQTRAGATQAHLAAIVEFRGRHAVEGFERHRPVVQPDGGARLRLRRVGADWTLDPRVDSARQTVERGSDPRHNPLGGERIEHFETVRMTKDGRYVDSSLSASPVRDSSSAVVGVAKIIRASQNRNGWHANSRCSSSGSA